MGEADRRAAILQLTCLVRPVRERAARLLQSRLREFQKGQTHQGVSRIYPRENSYNPPQQQQQQPNSGSATSITGGDVNFGLGGTGRTHHGSNNCTTNERRSDALLLPRIESAIGTQAQAQSGQGARREGGERAGGTTTTMFEAEHW